MSEEKKTEWGKYLMATGLGTLLGVILDRALIPKFERYMKNKKENQDYGDFVYKIPEGLRSLADSLDKYIADRKFKDENK